MEIMTKFIQRGSTTRQDSIRPSIEISARILSFDGVLKFLNVPFILLAVHTRMASGVTNHNHPKVCFGV